MKQLTQHIEALIFSANGPISRQEILDCLETAFETEFKEEELDGAIDALRKRYEPEEFAFELVDISGGLRFLTKSAFFPTVGTHLKLTTRKRLSRSALETLSIIAYKQPVTKSEMENIRGVGCDYALQKLLEKELVSIAGRSDGPGRPLLYGTSEKFMDYFGIKSLEDLPKPKDFAMTENTIGEQAPMEESIPVNSEEGTKEEAVKEEITEEKTPNEIIPDESKNKNENE